MHFLGACLAQHGDDAVDGGSAHDAVVDHYHALSAHAVGDGIQLDAHAFHALLLAGLDEGAADVGVLDDSLFIWYARFLGITNRRVDARFGNADNHVGVDRAGAGKDTSSLLARLVHAYAVDGGVAAGEIDVLKNADRVFFVGEIRAKAVIALLTLAVDDDDLAGLNVADELSAAGVKRSAFACHHHRAVVFAEAERTEAVRIAGGDDLARTHHQQRIGALYTAHCLDHRFLDAVDAQTRARYQVTDDLAVDGRLKNSAALLQLTPDLNRVSQVAVVGNGYGAFDITHNKRLRVFEHGAACC